MDFADIINNSPAPNDSGYFIETMKSLNTYIKGEFDKGRITGNDYAQVYIAAMQYALQNSFQYEIEQHRLQFEYAKSQEELELLRAQAEKVRVETAIEQEKLQLLKDTHQASIDKAYTEVTLLQGKVDTETKQQAVLDEQALKLKADTLLVKSKTLTETDQQKVLKAQASKLTADASLIGAKTNTETDQQNVLKAQQALYQKQTKGIEGKHNTNHLAQLGNLAAIYYGKGGSPDAMKAAFVTTMQSTVASNVKNPLAEAITKSATFPTT